MIVYSMNGLSYWMTFKTKFLEEMIGGEKKLRLTETKWRTGMLIRIPM